MKKLILLSLFVPLVSFGQNIAPVASGVSSAIVKSTNATIHLVASDVDYDSLTYSIVSDASNGTTSLSGDTVTYTPTTDFVGTDSFTFKAYDGALYSTTKTVTIKVIGGYKTTQTQLGTDIDGEAVHISDNLIRISVGLEDVDDIINDIDQALNNVNYH
jgi:hypothetical protein